MGKIYKIYYDQTAEEKFYLCRQCHTHIAHNRELITIARDSELALFENVASPNVLVDSEPYDQGRGERFIFSIANLHCVDCLNLLGFKIIHIANKAPGQPPPAPAAVGRFALKIPKLLMWDGVQIRDI